MTTKMEDVKQKIKEEYAKKVDQYFSQYEAMNENNKIDMNGIEIILGSGLRSEYSQIPTSREVDKFVAYAKGQGSGMSFDSMEAGILAAGRKDIQNGLTEILNSMKFDKPSCLECKEGMDNRGFGKKNSNQRGLD